MLALLSSPFLWPFVAGLPFAVVLPLLGNLLRLRGEWLAALGVAYLSSAAALLGAGFGIAPAVAATTGATVAAVVKQRDGFSRNSAYGVMILAGWSLMMLVAANTALGHALAQSLVDGQIYFASPTEAAAALVITGVALLLLPYFTRRRMRAHFFPAYDAANGLPRWRWYLGFDWVAAVTTAVAITILGVMAAFALLFLPALTVFPLAKRWRTANVAAALLGVASYLVAFFVALSADQPFGPLFVGVLLFAFASSRFLRTAKGAISPGAN
ncbi:metal ABC transporter permease [Hydrogenophilus thiooxidans]|uniref:metal ABC transporter permease n=1 Tax=Hydrogenophilus thiooxidans TaxID=2820326 RepID=UPI001C22ED77|nr:metal ABC transporter permease [Hydrogenophilus thiooxidans]